MLNKPINDITEQDLQGLINKQISESLQLEYKETIDISFKGEKKELCKDVSAIANAFGGKIIYGIKESKQKDAGSIPEKLTPIKDSSLKESMQQVITDGILPRMDFQIHSFKSTTMPDHEYVIIDIPQSIRGPHFVCLGGENRYYKRRDFESKKMDQREIEDAYRNFFYQEMKMQNLYDQIKKENPNHGVGLPHSAYCFLYFIPQYPIQNLFYSKFNHDSLFNKIVHVKNGGYLLGYKEIFNNSFEGFTNVRQDKGHIERQDVYFRNGCVLYSFSFKNNDIHVNNIPHISFDNLVYSLIQIIDAVSFIYKECSYLGNIEIKIVSECIDNHYLHIEDVCTSHKPIPGGKFVSSRLTSINKLLIDPKQELKPLLTHFMQSFGLNDFNINSFLS